MNTKSDEDGNELTILSGIIMASGIAVALVGWTDSFYVLLGGSCAGVGFTGMLWMQSVKKNRQFWNTLYARDIWEDGEK
jgi:hypothetical protein